MAVDLVGYANYGGVGAVLLVPDPVTHYRDRWRTLHVVRIGHQPADPGLHTKSPEEIPGYILTIARIRRRTRSCSTDAERRVARL